MKHANSPEACNILTILFKKNYCDIDSYQIIGKFIKNHSFLPAYESPF